ncbi:MAG: hypothetical protein AAGA54_05970 [Myxococcota bacterium]
MAWFGSRAAVTVWTMSALALTGCDGEGPQGTAGDDGSTSGTTGAETSGTSSADTNDASAGPTSASATSASTTSASTTSASTTTASTTSATTVEPTGSGEEGGSDETSVEPGEGWFEVGYGLEDFIPFDGELPVSLGPQGFQMFSLPLRGGDFPVPPDPLDFDHPDTPVLSIWADIEGIEGTHPSGHFAAYLDYPVPFSVSLDGEADYEFISVWLVIPETYSPQELAGREAVVHAELQCSDGQLLIDEHTLTVVDGTL